MNDSAYRRFYSDAYGTGYGVIYMNEFGFKYTELYFFSRRNAVHFGFEIKVEFLEFVFENSESKSCAEYRHVYFLKKIRYSAYVVLVTVSKNYAFNFFFVVYKISYIRNDEINSEHIVAGKAETAVYNDNVVAVFKHGKVLCYLAESAERKYFELFKFCFCHNAPKPALKNGILSNNNYVTRTKKSKSATEKRKSPLHDSVFEWKY